MKIFVGGMHHESCTFNPIVTDKEDIHVLRGKQLLDSKGEGSLFGAIDALEKAGCQVVPGLLARAVPNGEWNRSTYENLRDELLASLEEALPVDGVCLSLHGSMRVKSLGAAEGDILSRVRALCPDVPIVSSLDMHATVTSAMLKFCNGFVGYKTAPHVDTFETGEHAARMLLEALNGKFLPQMAAVRLPFLLAGEQSETSVQPMVRLVSLLKEMEKRPNVMAASYLLGFPWADTSENGVTALVVTNNSKDSAQKYALELSHAFWDSRADFKFYNETLEVPQALDEAFLNVKNGVFPVVLSDSGDNPTAGSSQDVTNFLKAIIADPRLSSLDPPLCYQAIYDPELCQKAISAGVGAVVHGSLGSSFDKDKSSPIQVSAPVKAVCKDWDGTDLALLDVNGVDVVVTKDHVGCYDPLMMGALGVKAEDLKVIVVKLGYLEPEIRAIAKRSILVLTDGSTNEVFSRLPYTNLPRPIYPLDSDTTCSFSFL